MQHINLTEKSSALWKIIKNKYAEQFIRNSDLGKKNSNKFEIIYKNGKKKKKKKIGNIEIEQHKFHQYKRPILMKIININKIIASNKVSFGKKDFKYFIGYKDANKLDLYAYFFQESACRRDVGKSKCMSFLIKDDELLEKI